MTDDAPPVDGKQKLKDTISSAFSAPDVKDKVVKFSDVRGQFLKAARKEFGRVAEFVISHKLEAMEKKIAAEEGAVPDNMPVSKFAANLIKAVDTGEVPAVGYPVMTDKVTPMLVDAMRAAPEQAGSRAYDGQNAVRPRSPKL